MKPETKEKIIQVAIAAGVSIVTIGILVLAILPSMTNIPPLTPDQFADASGPVPLSGLIPIVICIIVMVLILMVAGPQVPNEYDDMEPKKK